MHITTQSLQEGDFISSKSRWDFIHGVRERKARRSSGTETNFTALPKAIPEGDLCGKPKNGLMRKARLGKRKALFFPYSLANTEPLPPFKQQK